MNNFFALPNKKKSGERLMEKLENDADFKAVLKL